MIRKPTKEEIAAAYGIGGTAIWILPNPSGLNANYTPSQLGKVFGELREWIQQKG